MGALGDARFRRLLAGNSLSSFGDSALYLSLGIWAKDLTGSNAAAGAIFLAQGLGALSAPVAGHLADRVPRRRLLVVTNAATALVVLSLLAVRSEAQLWVMYAVAVAYGAAFGLLAAGGAGLVKDMLPDDDLASANAASTTISQGLRIASPLAGAALYARFGGGAVAVFDSATFLAAIAALLTVRVAEAPAEPGRDLPVRAQLLAGAAHIRRSPGLSQILMAAVVAMLVLGFYEPLTFAVIAALHHRPSFFGVLMSVQALGSIAGGLISARLVRRLGEARALGTALVAWAAASLIYAVPVVAAACGALVVFGIAVSLYAVAVATAAQRATPPSLQGRVNAATGMATNLAQTVSIATGAVLVGLLGYRPLLFTVAAVVVVAALPVLLRPSARVALTVPGLVDQRGPPA
ncbi:MAG TPA: MFS transporter [Acidimicrobiales bacterium]|nr:MFS transporter [Acidimicrobiales bacterium]